MALAVGLGLSSDAKWVCDFCGDLCDPTTADLNALDCTFAGCPSDASVYHQDCLEKYLRSIRCEKNRKTGFKCPRGCGKATRFPEPCPGKIDKSHPVHMRGEQKKKKKTKEPIPPPPKAPVKDKKEKGKEELAKKDKDKDKAVAAAKAPAVKPTLSAASAKASKVAAAAAHAEALRQQQAAMAANIKRQLGLGSAAPAKLSSGMLVKEVRTLEEYEAARCSSLGHDPSAGPSVNAWAMRSLSGRLTTASSASSSTLGSAAASVLGSTAPALGSSSSAAAASAVAYQPPPPPRPADILSPSAFPPPSAALAKDPPKVPQPVQPANTLKGAWAAKGSAPVITQPPPPPGRPGGPSAAAGGVPLTPTASTAPAAYPPPPARSSSAASAAVASQAQQQQQRPPPVSAFAAAASSAASAGSGGGASGRMSPLTPAASTAASAPAEADADGDDEDADGDEVPIDESQLTRAQRKNLRRAERKAARKAAKEVKAAARAAAAEDDPSSAASTATAAGTGAAVMLPGAAAGEQAPPSPFPQLSAPSARQQAASASSSGSGGSTSQPATAGTVLRDANGQPPIPLPQQQRQQMLEDDSDGMEAALASIALRRALRCIEQLRQVGFPEQACAAAVAQHGDELEDCAGWLLGEAALGRLDSLAASAAAAGPCLPVIDVSDELGRIAELQSWLGCPPAAVHGAVLDAGGDLDTAAALLYDRQEQFGNGTAWPQARQQQQQHFPVPQPQAQPSSYLGWGHHSGGSGADRLSLLSGGAQQLTDPLAAAALVDSIASGSAPLPPLYGAAGSAAQAAMPEPWQAADPGTYAGLSAYGAWGSQQHTVASMGSWHQGLGTGGSASLGLVGAGAAAAPAGGASIWSSAALDGSQHGSIAGLGGALDAGGSQGGGSGAGEMPEAALLAAAAVTAEPDGAAGGANPDDLESLMATLMCT